MKDSTNPAMSRAALWRIALVACLVCVPFALIGCGKKSAEAKGPADDAAVPVEVAVVTVGDISSYFTGNATLEADSETEVVAKVGGVVERILVEEGDYVSAGQSLAKLDDEKLAVQMDQANANLLKLQSDLDRARELFDRKLISEQEFQRAGYEYDREKAVYELRRLDVEYTAITSPISGVVAERMVKVGNMVVPNQPTFRVTDLDPLLAPLHVPERQAGKLKVGQEAAITVDAIPGAQFAGRVERISPVVDPSTGTVKVTVGVHDASRQLKPGMLARVGITHDLHAGTTLASRDAVIEEDNQSSVFVVRGGTAYRQTIQTGFVNTSHIEVLKGLAFGDTVVTTGKGGLKDSSKVDVVPGAASVAEGK